MPGVPAAVTHLARWTRLTALDRSDAKKGPPRHRRGRRLPPRRALAVQILATSDPDLVEKRPQARQQMAAQVHARGATMQARLGRWAPAATVPPVSELLARLGFATARAVIVCADELGFSLAANEAVYAALRSGPATSASLIVAAPWARGAAADYRGEDVGVQLALNAEHDLYRWGPLTHAPSLLDGDGGFPRTVEDVWEHADLDEVRREWRAQLERAIYWGFDVSHLAVHRAEVTLKPEFFDAYLDLADELALPIRLPSADIETKAGFPFRSLAAEAAVLCPARVVDLGPAQLAEEFVELLAGLPEGLTELVLRPVLDGPELRRAAPKSWAERSGHAVALASGGALARALEATATLPVSYRQLRAAMRSERKGR